MAWVNNIFFNIMQQMMSNVPANEKDSGIICMVLDSHALL